MDLPLLRPRSPSFLATFLPAVLYTSMRRNAAVPPRKRSPSSWKRMPARTGGALYNSAPTMATPTPPASGGLASAKIWKRKIDQGAKRRPVLPRRRPPASPCPQAPAPFSSLALAPSHFSLSALTPGRSLLLLCFIHLCYLFLFSFVAIAVFYQLYVFCPAYIYIYIYIYTHTYVYMYIYIYIRV